MTPPALKIAATLLAVCAFPVSAALVPVDHPVFGPKSLTHDTNQNLYWLTPIVTANLSFVTTQALLAGDVRFKGFRVATSVELENLYAAAAIPDINVPGTAGLYGTGANVSGVQFLQSLTGVTFAVTESGVNLSETAGFIGSSFVSAINGFLSVNIGNTVFRTNVQTSNGPASFASAYTSWGSLTVGSNAVGVGTWLVAVVPEPATLMTMLAGLAIVVLLKMRRERTGG